MVKGALFSCIILFIGCSEKREQAPKWTDEDRQFLIEEMERTTKLLWVVIRDLDEQQANYKASEEDWSILEIVEHLEVQNELHYREVSSQSRGPELHEYAPLCAGRDSIYAGYSSNPKKGKSGWYMDPIGRFSDLDAAFNALVRVRDHYSDFLEETESNLRVHFVFSDPRGNPVLEDLKPGDVRDLHQLVLTGLAHTVRHTKQIEGIKNQRGFPISSHYDQD